MATPLVTTFGYVAVLVMLAAVLGTVDRRERYAFVAGVVLVLAAMTAVPASAAGLLALVGFGVVVASTVPMLRA